MNLYDKVFGNISDKSLILYKERQQSSLNKNGKITTKTSYDDLGKMFSISKQGAHQICNRIDKKIEEFCCLLCERIRRHTDDA